VHHGWHGTHRYDIQVLATHASTWVYRYSSLLQWYVPLGGNVGTCCVRPNIATWPRWPRHQSIWPWMSSFVVRSTNLSVTIILYLTITFFYSDNDITAKCTVATHSIPTDRPFWFRFNSETSHTTKLTFSFHGSIAPVGLDFFIVEVSRSHSDTPQSVRPLWTRNRSVAQTTSTRQRTTLTADRHPCLLRDLNPQSQKRAVTYSRLRPRGHWDILPWSHL
jgi:hypothetical protein